jgi:alkylation response protein AidB-like acyl-CoA dehydrogenase
MTDGIRYTEAEALERHLGDPRVPDNSLSFAAARALDEADAIREPFMKELWDWGYALHCIPAAYGGRLSDPARSLALLRAVARRDVTTAHQLGNNLLGSLPVWVGGTAAQREQVAARLRAHGRFAFGLTERDHGADVLSNATTAVRVAGGYRLDGEKWLISQAATADVVSVMARTGERGDARGYSMFLVEKDTLAPGTLVPLPRETTLGLRGADISGLRLSGCVVPETARLGEEGAALDLALRSLSASKILVAGLAVAATEACLGTVLTFASERTLYGRGLTDIAHARATLASVFSGLLVADALLTFAARGLSLIPEQASILANVVKVLVPELCERLQRELAHILGARFYLREAHEWGVFEKMMRDTAIIAVFDGSAIVCLNAIAAQLGGLLDHGAERSRGEADAALARARRVADLTQPVPAFDPAALTLHSRGVDDLVQSLAEIVEECEARDLSFAARAGRRGLERLSSLPARIEAVSAALGAEAVRSRESYALAREYTEVAAVSAALHLWLANRRKAGPFFAEGAWLQLGLDGWMTDRDPGLTTGQRRDLVETVFDELQRRHTAREALGLVPVRLAGAP